jgi:hypothetical protein
MLDKTRSHYPMNSMSNLSMDQLGITVIIIKHGEDKQKRPKANSQKHRTDKQMANTQANLNVAMADLTISDVIIKNDAILPS